jgi:hypothetical protein
VRLTESTHLDELRVLAYNLLIIKVLDLSASQYLASIPESSGTWSSGEGCEDACFIDIHKTEPTPEPERNIYQGGFQESSRKQSSEPNPRLKSK